MVSGRHLRGRYIAAPEHELKPMHRFHAPSAQQSEKLYTDSMMEEFHICWCGFVLGVESSCFETIWPRLNLGVLEIQCTKKRIDSGELFSRSLVERVKLLEALATKIICLSKQTPNASDGTA
jgi:hypothetical protein